MKLKNFFNITLFSFLMIVPLIPMKIKFNLLPLSADFIFGSVLIVLGYLCIIELVIKKKEIYNPFGDRSIKFLSVFIGIFTLLSLLSVTYASHKSAALSETIRFLEYVFIFYLIIVLVDEITVERSFRIFYFTMIFASLFGAAQFLFNWSSFTEGSFFGHGRIFSTFVNPNYWGAAVNLVIFYPLIRLIEGRHQNRKLDAAAFCLFFFNLFFSSTRGSWIGFAIGVVLICFIRYRSKVLYFIGAIAALLVIPGTRHRFLEMFDIQQRFRLWKTGFFMFKDNFLKGVGNGNYIYKYQYYIKKYRELDLGKPKFSVHNSYIKMFAELGIFGGLSFVLMYIGVFNLGLRAYRESKRYRLEALAFIAFGGAYIFQNFFNNLVFIPQLNVFVWILAALLFKGMYLEKKKEA